MDGRKEYKMIVMDMDYTLLNREKKVSERNKQAIKYAESKGIIIVVATGRLFTSAAYYARLLGIETPIIASNGAIIREHHTGKTIYQNLLNDFAAYKMIELCKQMELYCHLYTKDAIYTERIINISERYTEWNQALAESDRIRIEVVPRLEELVKTQKGNILKAVVVDENREKLDYIRKEILKACSVSVSQSLKDNIEVMNEGVTKGNAVKILSEIYGIQREQVMAIGDNENDISMIEFAGLGVAMGNGVDGIKQAADYVTGEFDKDGVAQAIEKFVL
ncbi:MAG: Cof-type HAD-IIB family hydrolase [Bacillota bacterium]